MFSPKLVIFCFFVLVSCGNFQIIPVSQNTKQFELSTQSFVHHENNRLSLMFLKARLNIERIWTIILLNSDVKLISFNLVGFVLFYFSKKITRSVLFYYASGTLIGLFGSMLFLMFIFFKFMPKFSTSLSNILAGSCVFALYAKLLFNYMDALYFYVIAYFIISLFGSMLFLYWRRPLQSEIILKSIEYLLKASLLILDLSLLYLNKSIQTFFLSFFMALFLFCILIGIFDKIKKKLSPKPRKRLTCQQFNTKALDFTSKSLNELTEYCNKPENFGQVISKTQDADRMTKFLMSREKHINEKEMIAHKYEQELYYST